MFIKRATADVLIENISDLKNAWSSIVHSGNHFCSTNTGCPFVEQFDWDPDHFLYYRARAITANVPNSNGDYFPLEELRPSFMTFVGKGIYYNHDSDRPEKAFGIILDAVLHEYPDDAYVQILGAIDKEDIEKKRPGILNRVVQGSLKTTSMSVAVQKCVCSVCGNTAYNPDQLCPHMRPKTATYIKGKPYMGKMAFEYNYGLTFLEDSLVESPADSTAYIFQVYSSKAEESVSPKLLEHLQKYLVVKKAYLNKSSADGKNPLTLETIVDDQINRKLELKVKQLAEEKIRVFIDPVLQKIEQTLLPKLDGLVEQKVKEKEMQIGNLQLDKPEEKPSEKPPEQPPKIDKIPEPPMSEKKDVSAEEPSKNLASEMPEKKSSKDIIQLLNQITSDDNTKQVKYPKVIPERINVGNNLSFVLDNNQYVLYDGENKVMPLVVVPVTPKMKHLDIKKLTKFFIDQVKNLPTLQSGEQQNFDLNTLKAQSSIREEYMKVSYVRGTDFASSYFIAQAGDKTLKVSADEIIPKDIQEKILNNDETVVSPDDIAHQLEEVSGGSIEKLETEILPEIKAVARSFRGEDVRDYPGWTEERKREWRAAGWNDMIMAMRYYAAGYDDPVQAKRMFDAGIPPGAKPTTTQPTPTENLPAEEPKMDPFWDPVHSSKKVEASTMKKQAEFSWSESEIPSQKVGKPSDGPVMSVNETEANKERPDTPSGQASKVRQYYGRLPNKAPGEPQVAVNVQSSLNDEVHVKIEALRKELAEAHAKRIAAEQALKEVKEKEEKKDKTAIIEEILELVDLPEEDRGKAMQILNKFSPVQLNDVRSLVEIVSKQGLDKDLDSAAIDSLGGGLPKMPKLPKLDKGKGDAKDDKKDDKFDLKLDKGDMKLDKDLFGDSDSKGAAPKGPSKSAPKAPPKGLPKLDLESPKSDSDKPKMKSEASLPQVYLSEDTPADLQLTQLAIKSLES